MIYNVLGAQEGGKRGLSLFLSLFSHTHTRTHENPLDYVRTFAFSNVRLKSKRMLSLALALLF